LPDFWARANYGLAPETSYFYNTVAYLHCKVVLTARFRMLMNRSAATTSPAARAPADLRPGWLGPIVVTLSLVISIANFLSFAGLVPFAAEPQVVAGLLIANALCVLVLVVLIVRQAVSLYRARRAGRAGARLHSRIVTFFSLVAAIPAVVIVLVSWAMLDQVLQPLFSGPIRETVLNTRTIVQSYKTEVCANVGRESRLFASQLEGFAARNAFLQPGFLRNAMTVQANVLGFPVARLITRDGRTVGQADVDFTRLMPEPPLPEPADFEDAATDSPPCFIRETSVRTLLRINGLDDTYLYLARPVRGEAYAFEQAAAEGVSTYLYIEAVWESYVRNLVILTALITLSLLLSSVWLGLSFASRLMSPIGRLIHATDQVSTGNLYVQVPVKREDGDIAHLGRTFNNMIAQLRVQQNRIVSANDLIDQRRRFIEAVLSGVSAAVIGLDGAGVITVSNPSADRMLGDGEGSVAGQSLEALLPELGELVATARGGSQRLVQGQVEVSRGGRTKTLFVRLTREQASGAEGRFIVTLDDITDLVTAQRTSAWADVARRIAHEIKNPLTPIQLSAERIRRKYGRVIVEDREIFEQCTDTIVRQVDDIRRMVDEFSSFARMPKPRPEPGDVVATLRETLFLMRVGHPDVSFVDALPQQALMAEFDRRLIAQAVQNILKNATEGIAAAEPPVAEPRVTLAAALEGGQVAIRVSDNGKGFPPEGRQRLLEPYMTTRDGGTGLGLPIVAKIFEEHGGGIELLDAEPGPGAQVRMWFPATGDQAGDDLTRTQQHEERVA
jgi:two-component system nitrogen regulation sensor histidine kinase NtrY